MTFRSSKAWWPGLTWQEREGEREGGVVGRGGEKAKWWKRDGRKKQAGDGDGGRKRGDRRGEKKKREEKGNRGKKMRERIERWEEEEKFEDRREEKVIHRRGQPHFCLFATAVKPIFWLGVWNILYFIKLQSAALCLCWGSSDTLLL